METIEGLKAAGLPERWTDEEVIERMRSGNTASYEIIMRRYNQRLYRVARAILRDDAEAEDVIQDTYVRAYQNLHQFAGSALFSTWLTRIAVHEALRRVRLRNRNQQLDEFEQDEEGSMEVVETSPDPEQRASNAELGRLLEEVVLDLPDAYRTIVMMRDVEQMSTAETAEALDLTEQNVKVRLHRGHAMLRSSLAARLGEARRMAFPFMGDRCDRVVRWVFLKLDELEPRIPRNF
jgi:RNA polymerase sigma-70 factor (ECF subfamily)